MGSLCTSKAKAVPTTTVQSSAFPAWYEEALKSIWRTPQDIKNQFRSASICGHNRVVFNVGGNKYRLVVEVQYQAGIVWVKFVGTHAEYDRINVETVNDC